MSVRGSILCVMGMSLFVSPLWGQGAAQPASSLTYEELMGCKFTDPPKDPTAAPTLLQIAIPKFPGSWAVWASSGRDRRGHIWFGVCAHRVKMPSAHLYEFVPKTGKLIDRGDVVGELQRLGLHRPNEGQMKIHTRITQGADGHLYFASMDEEGESSDGRKLPIWGGHLWRYRLDGNQWEHLKTTEDAPLVGYGAGYRIFTLAYFHHGLYRYDTTTQKIDRTVIGAEGGHVSRNLLVDDRGHAYVPRTVKGTKEMLVTLVEVDGDLKEVGQSPLRYYTITRDEESHGIVAFQPLADRSIAFATDQGYLYRVIPPKGEGKAKVEELGWFHPRGKAYVGSMFTYDGKRHLLGATRRPDKRWEWVTFDLKTKTAKSVPLTLPNIDGKPPVDPLLYGSITRDNDGCFYLVGSHTGKARGEPIVYQARPAR